MHQTIGDFQPPSTATRFLRRHTAIVALGVLVLLVLPAYLAAMELQLIDLEYLASLCGFSGWGSGGS